MFYYIIFVIGFILVYWSHWYYIITILGGIICACKEIFRQFLYYLCIDLVSFFRARKFESCVIFPKTSNYILPAYSWPGWLVRSLVLCAQWEFLIIFLLFLSCECRFIYLYSFLQSFCLVGDWSVIFLLNSLLLCKSLEYE